MNAPSEIDPRLSVEEGARLLGVSTGTIRNWIKSRALEAETNGESVRIAYSVLAKAKLLRETELLALPVVREASVTEADVPRGIVGGIISPTDAPDRRFSLQDGLALAAWKRGDQIAEPRGRALLVEPPKRLSVPTEWATDYSGRYGAWIQYMLGHKDPAKLPPTFWDTRTCPDFIPPAGIFRAWYGGFSCSVEENDIGPMRRFTVIARTAVWTVENGKLILLPEDDEFDDVDGSHRAGQEPPEYAAMNRRYRELQLAWKEAWFQRRRELRALGIDLGTLPEPLCFEGRDRVEIIRRYHREHWSPADLPDWFFATDECPTFVPPTSVFRFEYGECAYDPRIGGYSTPIKTSAGWTQMMFEPTVTFIPAMVQSGDRGCYPEGSTPAESAEANLRYDLAEEQWREEWRQRGQWLAANG